MSSNAKLFGKYNDLALLIIGFLLTTVVGWILQHRSWSHQHELQQLEADRKTAEAVVSELSVRLDTRVRRMRQLAAAYRGTTSLSDIEQRWTDYGTALDDWNFTLNRSLRLVDRYFGAQRRNELEKEIQPALINAGRDLDALRGTSPADGRRRALAIAQQLDELNHRYYQFLDDLMLQLAEGAVVGRTDRQ
ncbi:MAG: hypothetical protein ACREMA_02685 [Longimicrobiales bacterium]